MILHVLPGDAIVGTFKDAHIEGDIAVCREALIDGDVSGETLAEFWENRARVLARDYADTSVTYHETVVREFAKLTALGSGSDINLWFEYELFCQTNMWFCLNLLTGSTAGIFRVMPVTLAENEIWNGFGQLTPDELRKCFAARVKMTQADVRLGAELWDAYRNGDHTSLERLSKIDSSVFPMLREVCAAAAEKDFRPQAVIREVIAAGVTGFENVFKEFKAKAGVYGYGDTQVKKIWQKLIP